MKSRSATCEAVFRWWVGGFHGVGASSEQQLVNVQMSCKQEWWGGRKIISTHNKAKTEDIFFLLFFVNTEIFPKVICIVLDYFLSSTVIT